MRQSKFDDPFSTSTLPQAYALAAATVLSYTLVIMLVITPRTFFIPGTTRSGGFLGGRGLIAGTNGSSPVVGVGRRPLLQKVAALTVAISLTLATVETLQIAKEQYDTGMLDAMELREDVASRLEMRIVRFISSIFLWTAQAQTLLRLFPRHKERKIIKWTAFALIVLDTVFGMLRHFVYPGRALSWRSLNVVPALRYLFQLALSVLYALWVVYYSFSKRKFAFFHSKMRNISVVAALALTAVLIPVIFFVLDVAEPDVSGWADYVLWVGAAAASVVVWEWVERIEALEREELQEGVLGREVFDGDDTPRTSWPRASLGRGPLPLPPPPPMTTTTTTTSTVDQAMNSDYDAGLRSRLNSYMTARKSTLQSKMHRKDRRSRFPVTIVPAPSRFGLRNLVAMQQADSTQDGGTSTATIDLTTEPDQRTNSSDI